MKLIIRIIGYYDKKTEHNKCIEYTKKYLKRDKYAENIYQLLMKYYSYMDNKPMIMKTFERCNDYIVSDLKIPLRKETEKLYDKLMSL